MNKGGEVTVTVMQEKYTVSYKYLLERKTRDSPEVFDLDITSVLTEGGEDIVGVAEAILYGQILTAVINEADFNYD